MATRPAAPIRRARCCSSLRHGARSVNPIHPLTFKPEFIDAYELGTKNTLLDGGLTLNGDVFFYNYTGYQISRIVDRTAINDNFNATVKGAELEAMWEPIPGLKFNFAGGYEDTRINNGQSSIDLMDRTAGNPDWMVVKPFVTQASNCILPTYVVAQILKDDNTRIGFEWHIEVLRAAPMTIISILSPICPMRPTLLSTALRSRIAHNLFLRRRTNHNGLCRLRSAGWGRRSSHRYHSRSL